MKYLYGALETSQPLQMPFLYILQDPWELSGSHWQMKKLPNQIVLPLPKVTRLAMSSFVKDSNSRSCVLPTYNPFVV